MLVFMENKLEEKLLGIDMGNCCSILVFCRGVRKKVPEAENPSGTRYIFVFNSAGYCRFMEL
jgi:hypothetical protein